MENNEFENKPQAPVFQEPVYEMPVVENTADNAQNTVTSRSFLEEMKDGAANLIDKAKQSGAADSAREFIDKAKQSSAADGARNILDKVKKLPLKMIAIIGVAAVAVIAVVALVIGMFTNTYKSPVEAALKSKNAKSYSAYEKNQYAGLNGFCESEAKAIVNIMKKSDDYDKDEMKESYEEYIDELKDQYGSNYKYSYKIEDKEKIDKDDYKDFQDELRDAAKDMLDEIKDMDSDDYEDMADELGISKSNAKKLVKEYESICKKLKKAKITAGYELEITWKLTGSELDEPEENETTMTVYKIGGKWVSASMLYSLMNLF